MTSYPEFYFIRHGQTDPHDDDREISLNEIGKKQVLTSAKFLQNMEVRSICHSPLPRALETKDGLSKKLKVPHFKIDELEECTGEVWRDLIKTQGDSSNYETQAFLQKVGCGLEKSLLKPGPLEERLATLLCHVEKIKLLE